MKLKDTQPVKMLDTKAEVIQWLLNMGVYQYKGELNRALESGSLTIHNDLTIDSSHSIYLIGRQIVQHLPVRFNKVGGFFNIGRNELTSFEGFPKYCAEGVFFHHNKFISLHNIHKHIMYCGGEMHADNNEIESTVLGVILIKELRSVTLDNLEVEQIVRKHLTSEERDVFACQNDLLEAGFAQYAKL